MLKTSQLPSRFPSLENDWQFSGWGSTVWLDIGPTVSDKIEIGLNKPFQLDQFRGSAVAGNDILGSVFYAFPSVVSVASVYSPLSLFIATLILFVWRPIMVELGSALPLPGAAYTYLLQTTGKKVAIVGATLGLLDFISTAVVSSLTAATYISGETDHLPIPVPWLGLLFLVSFAILSLVGLRETTTTAFIILAYHVCPCRSPVRTKLSDSHSRPS